MQIGSNSKHKFNQQTQKVLPEKGSAIGLPSFEQIMPHLFPLGGVAGQAHQKN
jgi:hypothetical protein